MGDKTEQIIQTREEYIRAIRAEMLGPGSEFSLPDAEHELLSSSPINRYSVGILYPQGNKVNLENDDSIPKEIEENEAESDDESEPSPEVVVDKAKAISPVEDDVENNLDEEVNMSSQYMPSSMGITFITSSDVTIVNGHISFGTYRDVKLASECMVPYIPATNPFVIPGELAARIAFDSDNNILSLKLPIERKDISMIKEKSGLYSGYVIPPALGYMDKRLTLRRPTDTEAIEEFEEIIESGLMLTETEKASGFYK